MHIIYNTHTQSEDNKEKKARGRRGIEVVLEVRGGGACHVGLACSAATQHTSAASKETKTERCYAPKKPFRDIESLISEVWWQLTMRGVALCLP